MTDWNRQLFSYCERALETAFWAEPLNAVSNGAFWIAGLAALVLWRRSPPLERRAVDGVLIALLFVIGAGSFLFHTYATRWAVLADVFPIIAFMLLYLGTALKRFFGWNWFATLIGVAVFFVVLQQAENIHCGGKPCFNGSVGYLPALAALLLIGGILRAIAHPAGPGLIAAGLIFAVSLAFRTIDRIACTATDLGVTAGPVGTHFLWHILNATLLFILVKTSIRHGGFTALVRRQSPL